MEKLVDINRLVVGDSIVLALRLLRGDKSNGEIGAKMGVSRQAVRQMLEEDNDIKFSSIKKYCDAVGYHLELVKNEE